MPTGSAHTLELPGGSVFPRCQPAALLSSRNRQSRLQVPTRFEGLLTCVQQTQLTGTVLLDVGGDAARPAPSARAMVTESAGRRDRRHQAAAMVRVSVPYMRDCYPEGIVCYSVPRGKIACRV